MVSGEDPVTLASDNIQVVVSNTLVTGLSNTVLSTPSTASQSFYGATPPKLALGPDGLSSCYSPGSGSGYAQLSLLQYSNNPFTNSQSIESPLIRFSMVSTKTTNITTTSTETSALSNGDKVVIPLVGVPAYTISLQFSVIQDFNFTAGVSGSRRSKSNFTLPACTKYNGLEYVPCSGCNISSYTNHNVTYGCFDLTQLCPSSSLISVRRSLESSESESDNNSSIRINSRGLRKINKPTETAKTEVTHYGVLVESLKAELASTLSINPFALDLSKAVVVLSFMGALVGFIIFSLVIFVRMDYSEKVPLVI